MSGIGLRMRTHATCGDLHISNMHECVCVAEFAFGRIPRTNCKGLQWRSMSGPRRGWSPVMFFKMTSCARSTSPRLARIFAMAPYLVGAKGSKAKFCSSALCSFSHRAASLLTTSRDVRGS